MVYPGTQNYYIPNIRTPACLSQAFPCLCDLLHLSKHQLRDSKFYGCCFLFKVLCLSLGSDQPELLAIGRWSQEKSKQKCVPPRESSGVTVVLFQTKTGDQNQKEENLEKGHPLHTMPLFPGLREGRRDQ